ncbi:MAG: heme-binding protein [Patescibacteria group bacterium]|nr:heme-binding protein [Patescibacteria group bacterium]
MRLSLEEAKRVIAAAQKKAQDLGVPETVAVVDAGGNLVALERQDGAIFAGVEIAINKAYTSAATGYPTEGIGKIAQPGQFAYGIALTNNGRIIIFEGGVPLMRDGKLVGGVGVSGGTAMQDGDCAEAGAGAL